MERLRAWLRRFDRLIVQPGLWLPGSETVAITLQRGRVMQSNFHDYRATRMHEAPQIEIHLIAEGGAPGGIGEPITAMIAPAVANAAFALTGKRLRSVPLKLA